MRAEEPAVQGPGIAPAGSDRLLTPWIVFRWKSQPLRNNIAVSWKIFCRAVNDNICTELKGAGSKDSKNIVNCN